MELSELRRDFGKLSLETEKMPGNPTEVLKEWLKDASEQNIPEFNAMVLSTVGQDGKPSSRVVLLKEIAEDGTLIFYTNYKSRKGRELDVNPNICINFFWRELERQVRVEGKVSKTSREISEQYFNSRPIESRISAIISPQSEVIDKLDTLQRAANSINKEDITLPEYWGGYAINPEYFEFWQGGINRLHDRINYQLNNNKWIRKRLAP